MKTLNHILPIIYLLAIGSLGCEGDKIKAVDEQTFEAARKDRQKGEEERRQGEKALELSKFTGPWSLCESLEDNGDTETKYEGSESLFSMEDGVGRGSFTKAIYLDENCEVPAPVSQRNSTNFSYDLETTQENTYLVVINFDEEKKTLRIKYKFSTTENGQSILSIPDLYWAFTEGEDEATLNLSDSEHRTQLQKEQTASDLVAYKNHFIQIAYKILGNQSFTSCNEGKS